MSFGHCYQFVLPKQIAFLSSNVFTDEWTNLERVVLVPYNQRAFEQTFTADSTAADVRQQLAQSKQSRPSNLSTLFAVLDSWQQQPAESPVHLLVFVSRIDQAAVDASRPFVQSLQQKNYALTFVAVGGQLEPALFEELSPNLIPWDVERQNVPAGWYTQFWAAYGCSDESPTQTPSPPLTCPTLTTQTPTPAMPSCQRETFAVMQDFSVSLDSKRLWRTLYYRIYGQVGRFWWGYYDDDDSWIADYSGYTPDEFNRWLVKYWQASDNGNLINQAAASLRAKSVRLVLVALNAWLDADLMAQLTEDRDTVQFWDSSAQAEPPNFERWFDYTVGCQATRIKNFLLMSEFFDGWTHPERIALYFSCTSSSKLYYPPDSFTSYTDLASVIDDQYSNRRDSCGQGRVGYAVYDYARWWNSQFGINYYRQAYVAFAGSCADDDISWIQELASWFHGPLTIVALNEGVITNATNAGFNVIDWSDPTASAPADWKRAFSAAFGCAGNPPTGR
ncbi:hypothetical protein M3Y99_00829300 [Aphelenchoides fujianensis]|nr:hypothetical protein M3Y99_00829300 [Aphelenchoides fujianensis]